MRRKREGTHLDICSPKRFQPCCVQTRLDSADGQRWLRRCPAAARGSGSSATAASHIHIFALRCSANTSASLCARRVRARRSPPFRPPQSPLRRQRQSLRTRSAERETPRQDGNPEDNEAILTHSAAASPPSRGVSSPASALRAVADVAMATAEG